MYANPPSSCCESSSTSKENGLVDQTHMNDFYVSFRNHGVVMSVLKPRYSRVPELPVLHSVVDPCTRVEKGRGPRATRRINLFDTTSMGFRELQMYLAGQISVVSLMRTTHHISGALHFFDYVSDCASAIAIRPGLLTIELTTARLGSMLLLFESKLIVQLVDSTGASPRPRWPSINSVILFESYVSTALS
jgi:hypothetical protein